jgi:hypothetical protein
LLTEIQMGKNVKRTFVLVLFFIFFIHLSAQTARPIAGKTKEQTYDGTPTTPPPTPGNSVGAPLDGKALVVLVLAGFMYLGYRSYKAKVEEGLEEKL